MKLSPRIQVLGVVLLAAFSTNLTLTILTIAIAPIAADFDASVAAVSWVTVLPIVVTALFTPAAGRAADRFGRRRLWLFGMTLCCVGIAASGLAPSLLWLIVARGVTGVGTAAVMPSGLAIALSAWPKEEHSKPVGWWTSTIALSPTLGVLVGGAVVEYWGWRLLFAAQIPLALLALFLAARVFPADEPAEAPVPFDIQGSVSASIAVFGLLLALHAGPKWGAADPRTWACAVAIVLGSLWFAWASKRAVAPIVPRGMFSSRITRRAIAVRCVLQAVYMGSFIILPVWMMRVSDWRPAAVAVALAPRPLAMGIMGPFAGALSARRGPRVPALLGGLSIALAVTILASLDADTAYPILLMALIFQGAGLALVSTGTTAAVTAVSSLEDLGATSGVVGVTTSLANALGMAGLLGVVASAGGEASASAYRWAFGIAAVCALCAALVPVRASRAALAGATPEHDEPGP